MANTEENKIFEETETVTIPDFVEEKTETGTSYTDPDLSIFKLSDDELYDDDDEEEEQKEHRDRRKGNSLSLILCLIVIFLLLATSVAAVYYGYKEHQAYMKANTSFLQMQANENAYKKQIEDKDAQIADLNRQIEELKSSSSSSDSSSDSSATGKLKYKIVDGPISFKTAPDVSADLTTFDGKEKANNGEVYNVEEIIEDSSDPGRKWAKINDSVYFCIGYLDSVWAEKTN